MTPRWTVYAEMKWLTNIDGGSLGTQYMLHFLIIINMLLIGWSVFCRKRRVTNGGLASSGASDNGGRCFPCTRSIFSSSDRSVAEKEKGGDVENAQHTIISLQECLQAVMSPSVSESLITTRSDGPSTQTSSE